MANAETTQQCHCLTHDCEWRIVLDCSEDKSVCIHQHETNGRQYKHTPTLGWYDDYALAYADARTLAAAGVKVLLIAHNAPIIVSIDDDVPSVDMDVLLGAVEESGGQVFDMLDLPDGEYL
jgi:hypothetical protein